MFGFICRVEGLTFVGICVSMKLSVLSLSFRISRVEGVILIDRCMFGVLVCRCWVVGISRFSVGLAMVLTCILLAVFVVMSVRLWVTLASLVSILALCCVRTLLEVAGITLWGCWRNSGVLITCLSLVRACEVVGRASFSVRVVVRIRLRLVTVVISCRRLIPSVRGRPWRMWVVTLESSR